jgi:ribosomal protein L31
MKTAIHPEYVQAHVRCTCGNEFTTRSTQPEIHVEVCSNCHPFYTGRQKLVDTGGRIDRFKRRQARAGGTRSPDGAAVAVGDGAFGDALVAQRDAPVGGQAVLEGVMMRGISTWAVAVRKPAAEQLREGGLEAEEVPLGAIEVVSHPLTSLLKKHRVLRLPLIRGVVALGESLAIGFKALGISANAQLPEDEKEISGGVWAGTVVIAVLMAVGLFFVVPVGLTSLIKDQLHSSFLFWLVEGVLRTGIFLGYLLLLSRLRDLRRVFEYHGAEHKTISCYEAGLELTPENAQRFSRLHPRCGTSFLLVVMIVAIFVFAPIGLPAWYLLVLTRIVGVPLIAGISFELIKFAGKNRRRRWVRAVMWPGLQLQKLTTREPDLDQLAVAIAAMQAVLAMENPLGASDEERVGMEVVA